MQKNAIVSVLALIVLVVGIFILTSGCASEYMPTTDVETTVDDTKVSFDKAFEIFRENPRAHLDGYTLSNGYLYGINGSTPLGSIHTYGLDVEGDTLSRTFSAELVYNSETNMIYRCCFGNVDAFTLPEATTYCGFNEWMGVICRAGNTIYLIDSSNSIKQIATDVEYVISCEYSYDHEFDSSNSVLCPLFFMKDGSLKVYDGSELQPTLYEGGWVNIGPVC